MESTNCKVVEGVKLTGIMNAKLRLHLPGHISYGDCKTVPIAGQEGKDVKAVSN